MQSETRIDTRVKIDTSIAGNVTKYNNLHTQELFIYLFIYLFNTQLDTMQIRKTYNSKTHNSKYAICKTSRQSTNRCLHY